MDHGPSSSGGHQNGGPTPCTGTDGAGGTHWTPRPRRGEHGWSMRIQGPGTERGRPAGRSRAGSLSPAHRLRSPGSFPVMSLGPSKQSPPKPPSLFPSIPVTVMSHETSSVLVSGRRKRAHGGQGPRRVGEFPGQWECAATEGAVGGQDSQRLSAGAPGCAPRCALGAAAPAFPGSTLSPARQARS